MEVVGLSGVVCLPRFLHIKWDLMPWMASWPTHLRSQELMPGCRADRLTRCPPVDWAQMGVHNTDEPMLLWLQPEFLEARLDTKMASSLEMSVLSLLFTEAAVEWVGKASSLLLYLTTSLLPDTYLHCHSMHALIVLSQLGKASSSLSVPPYLLRRSCAIPWSQSVSFYMHVFV